MGSWDMQNEADDAEQHTTGFGTSYAERSINFFAFALGDHSPTPPAK